MHRGRGLAWDALLCAGLAWLPGLYFWRLFAANRADQMTVADSDFTWGQFPLLLTAARSIHEGGFALWNPLSGAGQPLLAQPQTAALYPLSWIVFPRMQGLDPGSFLALETQLPIHLALASVFTYILGRVLIGSRVGALVAALIFAYSGFLTSYPLQQLPILRSASWFPLQVLGWWLALDRRSPVWAVVSGLGLALALLAGHPQTVFQEGIGLALVGLAWAYTAPPAGWSWARILRVAAMGLLTAAVAAGLSAAQWMPTVELLALSSRSEEGYNFLAGGFSLWEIPLDLVAPNILGGTPPYVGVCSLALAAAGALLRPSRLHAVFISLAAAGLLLSLGSQTFLFPALYVLVPGFDLFRNPERAIFLFSLAMALLAGAGARALLADLSLHDYGRLARLRRRLGMLLALSIVFGAALYVGHVAAEVTAVGFNRWREVVHAFFFAAFILAFTWGVLTARLVPSARPALPVLLPLLVAFDLFSVTADRQFALRPVDAVYHEPAVVERVMTTIQTNRVADRDILGGNHGLIYGMPSFNSTFPLRLARLDTAVQRIPEITLFNLLNVSHVITQPGDPLLAGPGLIDRLPDAGYVLQRRSDSLGTAYVVPAAQRADSADEALRRVASPEFDPRNLVIIEAPRGAELPGGGPGMVAQVRRGWNDVSMFVSAPRGGYLVLADAPYPGWRASVDGLDQPIWPANYVTKAVRLGPGDHNVRFRYEPDSVRFGMAISLLTLVAAGLGAIWRAGWIMGNRTIAARGSFQ